MAAYIAFYEDKENIIQSLVEGCSDFKTADSVFDTLVRGEVFLDSLFWSPREGKNFDYLYDTAIKAASDHKKEKYLSQLLTSRAFKELAYGTDGKTKYFLSKVHEIHDTSPSIPFHERGKYLCYLGINYLFTEEPKIGVKCLKEALSSLDNCNSPEQTILKLIIFQILAVYYRS